MCVKKLFRKKSIHDIIASLAKEEEAAALHGGLHKNLRLRDLVAFGIAAIIGAGIFGTIGKASFDGGPAIIFLFLFTALACVCTGFAYAEFASTIPVSGSAYTYAYVSFGELVAWIMGWALIFEYAIGNIVVAISWSDYFTGLIAGLGMQFPAWLTMDYLTAWNGFQEANTLLSHGRSLNDLNPALLEKYMAWTQAPSSGNLHLVCDLPAALVTALITWLVYLGIKESKNASNLMVLIKLAIIALVILCGIFYVNPSNWSPFAPNGISGVLKGVSAVFFAYIGFDAISTTAEECRNPKRDLPRAILYSVIICTLIFIAIALVLTGLVSYTELNVGDPLSYAFAKIDMHWISGIIAFGAVVSMASVLLVFQMGQPRIWMSMSRDGLLPKVFSKIHPKFKTPGFSTIVTGFVVAVPALFMNLSIVTDLSSTGTLFAFVIVCAGVIQMQLMPNPPERRFKTPYLNGKYIVPLLFMLTFVFLYIYAHRWLAETFIWDSALAFYHKVPVLLFFVAFAFISLLSYRKNLSLIPVVGLLSCLYLLTELGITNWIWFTSCMLIGLIIYFSYGLSHSKLNKPSHA